MAEKDIIGDLSVLQRLNFITWGMKRRLNYFDFIKAGMAQKYAYEKAKKIKKSDL